MTTPHISLLGADPTESDLDGFLADLVEVRSERHASHNQKSHGRAGYMSVDHPEIIAASERLRGASLAAEPEITADMQMIAAESGGTLEGLDFAVKGDGSTRRKLATDADYAKAKLPVSEREARIKDVSRYTQILSEDKYADGVSVSRVKAESMGYHVTAKNGWVENDSGYAGYHMTLRKEGKPPVELQFHTKASFKAKEIGDPPLTPPSHVLYESIRVTRYAPKRVRLQTQVDALWAPIRSTAPPGVANLPLRMSQGAGERRSV